MTEPLDEVIAHLRILPEPHNHVPTHTRYPAGLAAGPPNLTVCSRHGDTAVAAA